MKLIQNKYQFYILFYHLLVLAFNINSSIFKIQLLFLYPAIVFFREIKYVIKYRKFFFLFSLLSFSSIFLFVLRGYYVNASLPVYFFFFPLFILFYRENYIGPKIHLFLIITFLTFVGIQLLRGVGFNGMMFGRSRNMVAFYFFQYIVLYTIEQFRYKRRVDVWPAIIALIISMLAIGRSNIIVCALFLFVIMIYKVIVLKPNLRFNYLFLLISLPIIILTFFGNKLYLFFNSSLQRFSSEGLDSGPRDLIFSVYLDKMTSSFENFIVGFPLDHEAFELFDFNLHNSFLSMHYFFGAFGLIIIYIILKKTIFTKGDLFFKIILLLLFLRGYTDQIFFINFNDITIFYLIFLIGSNNDVDSEISIQKIN